MSFWISAQRVSPASAAEERVFIDWTNRHTGTFSTRNEQGSHMSDDTAKQGHQDRSRVAGDEPYEVAYFASKHGLTQAQARDLIERVGNDRAMLDAAAEKLNGDRNSG
jgi:hypothetical protein